MEQELRFGVDLGWMAVSLAFIASKSFDLWNHHIPQMKCAFSFDIKFGNRFYSKEKRPGNENYILSSWYNLH